MLSHTKIRFPVPISCQNLHQWSSTMSAVFCGDYGVISHWNIHCRHRPHIHVSCHMASILEIRWCHKILAVEFAWIYSTRFLHFCTKFGPNHGTNSWDPLPRRIIWSHPISWWNKCHCSYDYNIVYKNPEIIVKISAQRYQNSSILKHLYSTRVVNASF